VVTGVNSGEIRRPPKSQTWIPDQVSIPSIPNPRIPPNLPKPPKMASIVEKNEREVQGAHIKCPTTVNNINGILVWVNN